MTISTFPPPRNIPSQLMRHEPPLPIGHLSDDLDLAAGLRLIRRRIVLIVTLVTLFMSIAFMAVSQLEPSYYAEARLLIHRPLAATLAAEDGPLDDPVGLISETERLLSRTAAERVIRDLRLAERPQFNPALRKPTVLDEVRNYLRGLLDPRKPPAPAAGSLEPVFTEYYKALRVWRSGQGNVIHLSFDAADPELAAAVPNYLISIYLDERKNGFQQRLSAAQDWIRSRIAEQRARVTSARAAVVKHQERTGAILRDNAGGVDIKTLTDLTDRQSRIQQSRSETIAAIAALDEARRGAGSGPFLLENIALPESIGAIENDLRVQQRDLERLLETYGGDAQAVTDQRAAISRSGLELRAALDRYRQSLRTKLSDLNRENRTVVSALAAAHEQQARADRARSELAQLQRLADEEQRVLEKQEQQSRTLAGQSLLPGAEIEVLSPAVVPLVPQGRGRSFYMIGALLASFAVAVTAAFVADMLDKSVRSFDHFRRMIPTISAGFIPRLTRKGRARLLDLSDPAPRRVFAEAIRAVAGSLRHSGGGKLPTSIVVTSAHGGDGKSLVAASLAVELAASGAQVLLVDADLRHGTVHSLFGSDSRIGLQEFLSGQATVKDVTRHHSQTGVDFIPAGIASPERRIQIAGVADIIESARMKGRIVIFDSAPLLASTDTQHLTALADTTLFVVKWGKTRRRAVELSLHTLTRFRQMDIAITINDVRPRLHARYSFSDSELFRPAAFRYLTRRS